MYETFEHTADLGLRIRAGDLPELFAEAARALFAVIVADCRQIRPAQPMTFELEADRHDDLLRDWLGELLYTFHAEHLLLTGFNVTLDGTRLTATAGAESIDPSRHEIEVELKAVTYHGLKVEQTDDGWLAEVIIDT
ncbi:MAG: archease [Candidatus Nealsonbacteria bacterium]|nr:archease [Candidatus Nealsonbacteria bacterium]